MSTVFIFDCETSGLDHKRHGILEIAWIIRHDLKCVLEKNYSVKLDYSNDISPGALAVNGLTFDDCLNRGKNMAYVLDDLKNDLVSNIREIRAVPCGHNVQFDLDFLFTAADRWRVPLHYYLNRGRAIDTLAIVRWLEYLGIVSMQNHKLETVCNYFNISLDAHKAVNDVRAVAMVLDKMMELCGAGPFADADIGGNCCLKRV